MIRVTAPSRLHFGLLNVPREPATRLLFDGAPSVPCRAFGGVGLMVDQPGLTVRVERATTWSADGALAARALAFAQRCVAALGEPQAFRVVVEHAPPEHTGLGVGTQLGLAVAKAVAHLSGRTEDDAVALAQRVGRGERSAIGVHGFARGGLIVEAGKGPGETISPLVAHYAVPRTWQVLLLMPESTGPWHGQRERSAFAKLQQLGPTLAETEQLCRLLLMGMLPALSAAHFEWFSAALYEFNARVGDIFAPAQGGRYGSPAIGQTVQRLRASGVQGVGQSSWGPTVFALVEADRAAHLQAAFADVPNVLTSPAATGAQVWGPSLS